MNANKHYEVETRRADEQWKVRTSLLSRHMVDMHFDAFARDGLEVRLVEVETVETRRTIRDSVEERPIVDRPINYEADGNVLFSAPRRR